MELSDNQILSEAIRLVESGVSVTFPVNGRSMLPFIVGGRESLVLVKPKSVKVGDVVLAYVDNTHYVIHRILKVDGERVVLMGDGNLVLREYCELPDVKALATHVVNASGKQRFLYARHRKFAARLWRLCLPIRRYLLKIYLVTHKV